MYIYFAFFSHNNIIKSSTTYLAKVYMKHDLLQFKKRAQQAGCRWLSPATLATQEAEIWRIGVRSQPRQIVRKTLSRKNPSQKRAGGVAEGVGPELKPHYCKTNKQTKPAWLRRLIILYSY
jgi:hypothetical protein